MDDDDLHDLDEDAEFEPMHWFDRLGVGTVALFGTVVAMLSLITVVVFNQIIAAHQSRAGTVVSAQEAEFAVPANHLADRLSFHDAPRWIANASPFESAAAGLIAMIVVDDGRDPAAVTEAMDSSAPLTLALAHDFNESRVRAEAARRAGRDVLVALPFGYGPDLGRHPNVLAPHLSEAELRRRTLWHLAAIEGHVGAIDLDGEAALRSASTLRPIMRAVLDDGGLFIETRADTRSLAGAVARQTGIPTGIRTALIAADDDRKLVFSRLSDAERHAQRWGYAIVVVPGERTPLAHLGEWLVQPRAQGTAIAPVSTVISRLRGKADE